MDLNDRQVVEQLQDLTDTKRINKWKHNEKRTIIVTFKFEKNNDYCLLSQNKIQTLLKQLFANDTNLIFHTKKTQPKAQKYEYFIREWHHYYQSDYDEPIEWVQW